MNQKEVLVVGAGPTGLILAIELLRRKVPIRLIEKRNGPSHISRAMAVQARSMEMFDHMGVATRLAEIGLECPGSLFHFPNIPYDDLPRSDFRVLPTRYPFYYKIVQCDLEQVLRDHLVAAYNVVPEFGTELTQLVQDENGATATIKLPNQKAEEHQFSYVVGCDGSRSSVRDAAGIQFHGGKTGTLAQMDVKVENMKFDDAWFNYFFNKDLFMAITKIPGKYWRVYMGEPSGKYVFAEDRLKAFQEVADAIGIGCKFGELDWATAWTIFTNMAEKYRNKRLILCGDASHVHHPSGGQGMNGCMQDAFNLGWKLAAVYHGLADDRILDSYEKERKPIGEQITAGAAATHRITMGFGTEVADRLAMVKIPEWQAKTVNLVAGMSHNYCNVVTIPEGLTKVEGPQAGERPPDALLVTSPRKRLYDVFRRPQFTLVVFAGSEIDEHVEIGLKLRQALDVKFPQLTTTYLITAKRNDKFGFDVQSADELGELAERYMIGTEGRLIVVRPDLYIGMTCLPKDWEAVPQYFDQWFNVKPQPTNGTT